VVNVVQTDGLFWYILLQTYTLIYSLQLVPSNML